MELDVFQHFGGKYGQAIDDYILMFEWRECDAPLALPVQVRWAICLATSSMGNLDNDLNTWLQSYPQPLAAE